MTTFENSFVTFTNQDNKFISDRSCGFQREFCIPAYDGTDIAFLVKLTSTVSYLDPLEFLTAVVRSECDGGFNIISAPTIELVNTDSEGDDTIYWLRVTWPTAWSILQAEPGDCFYIRLMFDDGDGNSADVCSNCFSYITDKCFTTVVKYANLTDVFGFPYSNYRFGSDYNIIRLPMWLSKPQYPKTGEYYERSDGTKQTLFARFNRQYEVICDDMPEWWMKNLLVAISHDEVFVIPENSNVLGTGILNVVSNDDWEISWPEMKISSANWGRPKFTLLETPFVQINNNCEA